MDPGDDRRRAYDAVGVARRRWAPIATQPPLITSAAPLIISAGVAAQLLGDTGERRSSGSVFVVVLFSAALAVPLIARHFRPVTVFAVVAAVATVQWACDVRTVADVALLVAAFTVTVRRGLRLGLATAAVVELGALLAVARWEAAGDRWETFVLLSAVVAVTVTVGVAVRYRRESRHALLEQARAAEQAARRRVELDAAAERARVARELHDIVAHGLSLMITLTDATIAGQERESGVAAPMLHQAASIGRHALADMSRLLTLLRDGNQRRGGDDRAPQPDLTELPDLIARVRAGGLTVHDHLETFPRDTLDPLVQLTVVRIVQEALTNVVRHARRPRSVDVQVTRDRDRLLVQVQDDGEDADGHSAPGNGLTGMRERVRTLGGEVTAGPGPDGRGWRVHAWLPASRAVSASAEQS